MVYDTLEAKGGDRPAPFASESAAGLAGKAPQGATQDDEAEKAFLNSLRSEYESGENGIVPVNSGPRPGGYAEDQSGEDDPNDGEPERGIRVVSEDGPDHGDLSDAIMGPNGKPIRNPKELIARLRKTVAEKDYALLQASLSNVDLRQELDETKSQTQELEKQLTVTLKANEALTRKASEQAAAAKGNWRSDADAARREQQFRVAQKALEKEHARVKEELVVTKGELHRATQQVEAHARARRMEAAQASAKIARLEGQVTETATAASAAGAELTKNGRKVRTRLSAAAGIAALILAVVGVWSWYSGSHAAASDGQTTVAPTTTDIHTAKYVTPATPKSSARPATSFEAANAQLANSRFGGSQASFSSALGRLNNSLAGMTATAPELVLKEVREKNAKSGVSVCDFEWNGGQPALIYKGTAGLTLDASLNRCAIAVEEFIAGSGAIKSPGH
jgi:hypothetical protein